ncbi:peptide/nickel transport system substrate-binding protein [Kibdelosporangium banguiense]|uniref:Peptide/nickel transport system substrate-binding protein n=1 Tax=Kibdelosporangium banguiense TaxID=1365924 RepID=A0ABS4TYA9_9PSEU|nr:ABC transporter substrate-binding protein [Kibdelosporangium banguiense]MBP2329003.1 peptide/nickel transport system substrate-binding protein [Kibdelosporangium banguiense]
MADSGVSRRCVLQLGGSVALLLATGACAAGSKEGGSAASTLRIAVTSYLSSWDQDFVGFDLTAFMLYKNVFPYLIDYGVTEVAGSKVLDTRNIMPAFAESFEPSADQKVWTLKLRRGVKFASGNEMKAADVKWSKDRAFAAQANVAGIYGTIGLTKPDQVEIVDDYTVRFTQAFPSALTRQIQAISLYVFDSVEARKHATDADPWAKDWVARQPPTGGYFNVTKATQGQEIVLEANPGYPGPDPAKTKNIRISVVPDGSNQRLQLQNSDIDVALGIGQRDIADLKKTKGVTVVSAASNEQVAIQMSVTTAPFNDINVRKALAYAVPYEQIIANVYGGDARPAKSVVPIDTPGYDESGYPFTYDVEKAKAALAGRTVNSELVFETDNDTQQRIAVLVQSEARKAGIELKLTPLDPATLDGRRQQKNVPLQITSGQLWVNDVEYMLATSFVKDAALNYSGYLNPEIERIYEQSHTTIDEPARLALWKRVQQIFAADVPWVIVCQPNFSLPVRSSVSGWVQPTDGLARLRYLSTSG